VTTRDGHGQRRVIEQALMRLGHMVGEK